MPQGGRRVDESIEEVTTTTMTRKRNTIIGEDIRVRGAGGVMMMRGVGEDTTT